MTEDLARHFAVVEYFGQGNFYPLPYMGMVGSHALAALLSKLTGLDPMLSVPIVSALAWLSLAAALFCIVHREPLARARWLMWAGVLLVSAPLILLLSQLGAFSQIVSLGFWGWVIYLLLPRLAARKLALDLRLSALACVAALCYPDGLMWLSLTQIFSFIVADPSVRKSLSARMLCFGWALLGIVIVRGQLIEHYHAHQMPIEFTILTLNFMVPGVYLCLRALRANPAQASADPYARTEWFLLSHFGVSILILFLPMIWAEEAFASYYAAKNCYFLILSAPLLLGRMARMYPRSGGVSATLALVLWALWLGSAGVNEWRRVWPLVSTLDELFWQPLLPTEQVSCLRELSERARQHGCEETIYWPGPGGLDMTQALLKHGPFERASIVGNAITGAYTAYGFRYLYDPGLKQKPGFRAAAADLSEHFEDFYPQMKAPPPSRARCVISELRPLRFDELASCKDMKLIRIPTQP